MREVRSHFGSSRRSLLDPRRAGAPACVTRSAGMPAKKESAVERARRLEQKSHELRARADFMKMCGILKNNEQLVNRFKETLVNLGQWADDDGPARPKTKGEASGVNQEPKEEDAGESGEFCNSLRLNYCMHFVCAIVCAIVLQ